MVFWTRLGLSAASMVAIGFGVLTSPRMTHAAAGGVRPDVHFFNASQTMLRIINRDRKAHGLGALSPDPALQRAALGHSADMAQHSYFSHIALDGSSPFTRILREGERYTVAGENLGTDVGTDGRTMLRAIEVSMLNSPEHRANLLRATFTRVGIGVVITDQRMYVTEDFAG